MTDKKHLQEREITMLTIDEIKSKYCMDAPRVRSNKEKAKRLEELKHNVLREGMTAHRLDRGPKDWNTEERKESQYGRLLRFQAEAGYDKSKGTKILQEAKKMEEKSKKIRAAISNLKKMDEEIRQWFRKNSEVLNKIGAIGVKGEIESYLRQSMFGTAN